MVEATGLAARDVDQLRRSCADVIGPGDAGYDDARRLWNALHDRRPSVIVRPTTADEVATAIRFARDRDLEITVKSGGHSAAALTGAEGCLLVDLSSMRGVAVDAAARTARVNGGALLGELDVAAQEHGLVCPVGVVGHTGVAGLTLGGGVGRLQRNFGLTIDSLTAVELVTADGRRVRAAETDEPELFWGLRGAGWNFGIATAFEFRLRPFGPDLHRGVLTYPATAVHDVWQMFEDYARNAPDAVAVIFGLGRAGADEGYPDDVVGRPIVFIGYNHSGAAENVERDTAGLHVGPKPLTSMIGSQPYLDVQTAHDLVFAWGTRSLIKSQNVHAVPARALDAALALLEGVPGDPSVSVTALGGAIARVPDDTTAFPGRTATFDVSADTSWTDAADDEASWAWIRRTMALFDGDPALGGYPNGNSESGPDAVRRIYGDAKMTRLAALKRTWDPDNVFRVNQNIPPGWDSPGT
ncbi:MAG TPA: FAD-binding oxidoreductase [Candidatus Limnocylindrales bacterium]|nr:FAD-binding oxidoreductase [Candidatus Limnocylindrales bacterium]